MDFDTFCQAIGADWWALLDTDGIQYVVFMPICLYLKQSCLGWRVEHQPDDCTAYVITGGHPSPEAAMAAALTELGPFRGLSYALGVSSCVDYSSSPS